MSEEGLSPVASSSSSETPLHMPSFAYSVQYTSTQNIEELTGAV